MNRTPHSRYYLRTILRVGLVVVVMGMIVSKSLGQTLYDTFSDGDFTASPVWGGNTSYWTIVANSDAASGATGSNTLRLNGPAVAQTDYLSSQIAIWGNIQEWGFFVGRRAQAFTAANQAYFWLYANESNLKSATVDGYRIAIGDDSGNDEIRLEYIVNGAVSATVITSAGSITNGLTDIGFLVRVTRSYSGLWTLFTSVLPSTNGNGAIATDIPNSTNAATSQGSATNNNLLPASNGYIGVAALHSIGASAIIAQEFDQIFFTPTIAFVTTSDGDWDTGSTWVGGSVPNSSDNVIIAHNVTSGARSRDASTTTTINAGASLVVSGTYTNSGTTAVNGTFQLDDGGWASGTNFVYGTAGTLSFNTPGRYDVNPGDVYWPTTNGPYNVNVLQGDASDGGLRLNSADRTINGTLALWSGVSQNSSNLTINGTLQINTGGWSTNTPTFGSSSTLEYNAGGPPYDVGNEWTGNSTTAGAGVPNNVTINGSTTVNMPGGDRGMAGNLTVSNGTLVLSSTNDYDLYIAGNLYFSASGSLTANYRAIFFTKNGTQTISSVNALTIPYIVYQPSSGSTTIKLLCNLTIDAPGGGNAIAFSSASDIFDIIGNSLTIGTSSVANTVSGDGAFSGSATSNLTLNETVFSNTLNFSSGSQSLNNLTINRTSSGNITLGSALTVANSFSLDGLITLGDNHLTVTSISISPDVDNMVVTNGVGEFRKVFDAADSFTFPIGESTGTTEYTPATLTFTGGTYSGYVGVRVVDEKHPENEATVDYITRYWAVSSSGITPTSYDFSGTYTAADIAGTESNSTSGRWDGTIWTAGSAAASNQISVTGLTTLPATNDFSAGSPLKLAEINIKQGSTIYLHNSTYDFGEQLVDSDTDVIFTIENFGTENLTLDAPTIGGSGFSYQAAYSSPVTGPTGTTTFTIRFTPTSEGDFSGSISIPHNDASGSENPYIINFMGKGTYTIHNIIFVETMYNGTGGANGDAILTHETNDRFEYDVFTMSGTGDMRNTSVSNYPDASGTWNVMLNGSSEYFQIAGINTLGYSNLSLSFGIRKNSNTETGSTFTVSVSSNGTNWSNLTMPALPTGENGWYYRTCTGTIPATNTLFIKFSSSSTVEFRIDDVKLEGDYSSCSSTISSFSPIIGPVGTVVTITGEDLDGLTGVSFNGVPAIIFSEISSTAITAVVPDGASTGKIRVATTCSVLSIDDFTVISQSGTCTGTSPASDLFISEYVEGSSSNKYIEIFNGTGSEVDLSDYKLRLFSNGASSPTNDVLLSGTLANGNVVVYKNSSATIYSGDATANTAVNFNGDDAVALWKVSTSSYVDIFGKIGNDPGTAWTSGSFSTLDKTLVRKSSVTGGVTTNPDTGFPTLSTEWIQYNTDVISNLGSHTYSAGGSPISITAQPISVTACEGQNAIFTVTAEGATGYQWYWYNEGDDSWDEISGETNNTYTLQIEAGFNGFQYFCMLDEGSCYLPSNTVTITVITENCCYAPDDFDPADEIHFTNITATSMDIDWDPVGVFPTDYTGYVVIIRSTNGDDFPILNEATSLPSGNSAPWSDNDIVFTAIDEIDGFTISGLEQGVEYFFKVYPYTKCGSIYKFNNTGLSGSSTTLTQANTAAVCALGSLDITLPITSEANTQYQWQVYNGSEWVPVSGGSYSGEDTKTLTINPLSQEMNGNMYICQITNSSHSCVTTSAVFTIAVNPLPETPFIADVEDFCGYTELTQGTPPAGVTWFWQGNIAEGTDISNDEVIYTAYTDDTYYLRAQSDEGCWSESSAWSNVTIVEAPDAPTASDVYICGTGTATLEATIGIDAARVDWSLDAGTTISYSDDEAPFEYDVPLTDGGSQTVYVRSSNGICNSDWISVNARSISKPVFTPGLPTIQCYGNAGSVFFTASVNWGSIVYSIESTGTGTAPTIDPATGEVTFYNDFYGDVTITATPTTCDASMASTHELEVLRLTPTIVPQ